MCVCTYMRWRESARERLNLKLEREKERERELRIKLLQVLFFPSSF